jgi:uncharacterized protein DUF732
MRPGRDFGTPGNYETSTDADKRRRRGRDGGTAYADPASDNDADFLAQLRAAGLTYQDPAAAISAAKDVCALVDNGTPDTDIVNNLQLRNPGFTGKGAVEFTALAAGEYCPKYLTGEGRPPKPTGAEGN